MFETIVRMRVLLLMNDDDDDDDADDNGLDLDLADCGVTNRSVRQWVAESSNWRYAVGEGASCSDYSRSAATKSCPGLPSGPDRLPRRDRRSHIAGCGYYRERYWN